MTDLGGGSVRECLRAVAIEKGVVAGYANVALDIDTPGY